MSDRSGAEMRADCVAALARLQAGEAALMASWLRRHIFEHVLPFWERHALNPSDGLATCIADDGTILTHDKWLWSQWRAVWVFSRLVRRHGGGEPWRQRACAIADFCLRHGWDERARGWVLLLDRDGRTLRGPESIYTDAFAVLGLVELHRVTGEPALLDWAQKTADAALEKLARPPDTIPHFPYPIPAGAKPHGLPMIWSLVFAELAMTSGHERYRTAALTCADEVFRDFHRKNRDVVLEYVRLDGGDFPWPEGTAIVPGHALEGMWFQIHLARLFGLPATRAAEACRLIRRHLELGWDRKAGGGLLLAIDADGQQPVGWKFADTKVWWPQTEALYAALLAWRHTGDGDFLEWYGRLWRVCLEHFVDWTHGEWRQKLNRRFEPVTETIALPVKDPFHLPRSLLLQIELLDELSHQSACPRTGPRAS